MIHIIPEPKSFFLQKGKGIFHFSADTALVNTALSQAAIEDFQKFLSQNFHFQLSKTAGDMQLSLTLSEGGNQEA